jgi:hypothetical protein
MGRWRTTDASRGNRDHAVRMTSESRSPESEPALHARVRAPNGREGEVIGFYRRSAESVLVRFAAGDAQEFLVPEIERLPAGADTFAVRPFAHAVSDCSEAQSRARAPAGPLPRAPGGERALEPRRTVVLRT